ncbi:MAG: hypothetical protein K2I62_00545, partial [Alistipes sp.]|nr:hypothetical protein [Alistipes sp.]
MKYTSAAEAVRLIRPHDSVYIQGSTSIPETLVAAMAARGTELDIELSDGHLQAEVTGARR